MISIFLSSTFQNMQHERDLIHKYVYPVVRDDAIRYGETLSIIDLRWGVDTSNMTSREALNKVLHICRDKIHASRPFFIALLGTRYGSTFNLFQDIRFKDEISITEFEINECISATPENAFFFIRRDIDHSDFEPRQRKLIDRITKDYPCRIVDYKLPDNNSENMITAAEHAFIQQMIDRIREYIVSAANQKSSNHNHEGYIREHAAFLYGRDGLVSEVQELVNRPGRQMLFIHGPIGIGKRSVLYRAVDQSQCRTVLVSSQINACFTADAIVDEIVAQAADLVNQMQPEVMSHTHTPLNCCTPSSLLTQVFQKYLSVEYRPLVILVEDVDLLLKVFEQRKLFNIIESIHLPIKWCVTGISEACIQSLNDSTLWNVKRLFFLSEADRRSIINGIYNRNNKELPKLSLDALLEKQSSSFPEYIQLVATVMNNFDQDDISALLLGTNETDGRGDTIAKNMRSLIQNLPEDTVALYHVVLSTLQSQVPTWASASIVEWLSYCPQGLREDDLRTLTEAGCIAQDVYSEIGFYLAFRHLQQILSVSAQKIWRLRYPVQAGTDTDKKQKMLYSYIAFLEQLPQSDPIRTRDLLLRYIEADMDAAFTRELSVMGEQKIRVPGEQLRTILSEHMPWMVRMIPQCPIAVNFDAISAFIGFCTDFPVSPKQYSALKQYLILFFEAASCSTDDTAIPGLYRTAKFASLLAIKNRDAEMHAKWRVLSDECMESAQKAPKDNMPHLFQEIMHALHESTESTENLREARTILDRGLPPALCRFVLKKAENNLQAVEDASRNLGIFPFRITRDRQSYAVLHELYGDCFSAEEDYSAAVAEYELSMSFICAEEMDLLQYSTLQAVLTKIGTCYMRQNRLNEAMSAYEDAVHSVNHILEQQDTMDDRVRLALTKCRIAEIYALQKDYKSAILLLVPLNSIFENVNNHMPTVQSMKDYAVFCYQILKYEHCSRINPSRGIEYGQRAALLYMQLKQATGSPEYIQNAGECLRMLADLEEETKRR